MLFQEAVDGGQNDAATCQTLGELYLHERLWKPALRWLNEAWQQQPSALRLERLVMVLTVNGRDQEAHATVTAGVEVLGSAVLDTCPLTNAVYRVGDPQRVGDQEDDVPYLVSWANWLFDQRQWELARTMYERTVAVRDEAFAYARLGHIHRFAGRLTAAHESLARAVNSEPDNATYLGAYANVLMVCGAMEAGLTCLRQAVEQAPDNSELFSSYLFNAHYSTSMDQRTLCAAHRRWGERFGSPTVPFPLRSRERDPERPLRIGYLGADFRRHSTSYTLEGIYQHHDRDHYHLTTYASVSEPDAVTERFQTYSDTYRDIQPMEDAAVAQLIHEDGIDILVAVAGHSFGNRLQVLAYQPAPVQVDYGGINTVGLQQVNYRITDVQRDPAESQDYFLENLVYLPEGSTLYVPPLETPAVNDLPAARNGFITFCNCNGVQKLNRMVLQLWAQVLGALPDSRMLLKCTGGDEPIVQQYIHDIMTSAGIDPQRVTLHGFMPHGQHLAFYHEADIMLDTYPFNGGVTTMEGLWMGVPTITLVGKHSVARTGLSLLTSLGLSAFAAESPDKFLQKALALADNLPALAKIRERLRPRMLASTLCDGPRYAAQLEQAYRLMWRRHCEDQS
jgi:predicted O-linked N-acetylglucosamine transferase (SPINDLY family)